MAGVCAWNYVVIWQIGLYQDTRETLEQTSYLFVGFLPLSYKTETRYHRKKIVFLDSISIFEEKTVNGHGAYGAYVSKTDCCVRQKLRY